MDALSARRLGAMIVVVACNAALAHGALAADPPAASEPAAPEADRLFEQGVAARKEGKLTEAEALFQKAWALKKTWDIAANLGIVQLNLGKLPEGMDHVYYAITELPPAESDAMRDKLLAAFDSKRGEVGGIDVHCNVQGAEVLVNGTPKGTTPIRRTFFVAPGQVTIEVRKEGYVPQRRTVQAGKASSEQYELTLVKETPPPERSKVPALVIGGVSVASLVAGGVLYGVSATTGAELRAGAPRGSDGELLCRKTVEPPSSATAACDAWRAKAAEAGTLGNAGIGLFVVGGVAAAGAVAAYLLWPAASPSQPASAWRVTPVVGAQGGGAILQGNF